LLKRLSSRKDVNNEELNKDDETSGNKGSNEEEETPKVVIVTPSPDERVKEEETKMLSKMKMLEEKVRAMQGMDAYGEVGDTRFLFVSNIEIPTKFEVLDFENFEGKTDPAIHSMYT